MVPENTINKNKKSPEEQGFFLNQLPVKNN